MLLCGVAEATCAAEEVVVDEDVAGRRGTTTSQRSQNMAAADPEVRGRAMECMALRGIKKATLTAEEVLAAAAVVDEAVVTAILMGLDPTAAIRLLPIRPDTARTDTVVVVAAVVQATTPLVIAALLRTEATVEGEGRITIHSLLWYMARVQHLPILATTQVVGGDVEVTEVINRAGTCIM